MKAVLVGLGSAGFGWYKRLKERGLLAAVVDVDERTKEKMADDSFPFYTSLQEALENEQVDFVVNITSPTAHTKVNHMAIDYKLPILCEKPISYDYFESIEIVKRAAEENIPFMVAENYRRWPFVRKIAQLLKEGAIGDLSVIDITFYRYHREKRQYSVHLLRDIGIHHFDMIRYLSGVEGRKIHSILYNPCGGWKEDGTILNANTMLELENDIRVNYIASIATRGKETPWAGDWLIEGTEGAIQLINKEILLTRKGTTTPIDHFNDVDQTDTLDEFLSALAEGRDFETSGKDYLKAEALVHYAEQSSKEQMSLNVKLPEID